MAFDEREYQAKYRAEHKEHIAELKRRWYAENKEQIAKKRKRKMHCYWCDKEWDDSRNVLEYKSKLFCNEQCLGKYLVEKVDDEIRDVWIDTEENRKMCVEEDKYDAFI